MRRQFGELPASQIETDNQSVIIFGHCEVEQNEQNIFFNVKTIQQKQYSDCPILTRMRKSVLGVLFILAMLILVFGLTISKFKMLGEDFTFFQIFEPQQWYPCAKKHKIVHIWVGTKPLPLHYQKYIDRCKDNTILLGNDDLKTYIDKWNEDQPEHFIGIQGVLRNKVAVHTDLLRKLYLYFESGIYSDLDTVIDEECFDNIMTDEIIFTNSWGSEEGIVMPEQNFMMVLKKRNPNMKRWIYAQLSEGSYGGTRWNQCSIKPCFVINCQKHNYEGTWK